MKSVTELPPPIINHTSIDNSTRLTIQVIGYEYSELQIRKDTHDYDANWYDLSIGITQATRRHSRTEPAMLTEELIELIGWFDLLIKDQLQDGASQEFIEPYLAFKHFGWMEQDALVGITLNHEIKPDFPPGQSRQTTGDWTIVLRLSKHEIREILDSLDQVLTQFPCR